MTHLVLKTGLGLWDIFPVLQDAHSSPANISSWNSRNPEPLLTSTHLFLFFPTCGTTFRTLFNLIRTPSKAMILSTSFKPPPPFPKFYSPTNGWIQVKLGGHGGCVKRTNWFDFGEDTDTSVFFLSFKWFFAIERWGQKLWRAWYL